MFTLSEEWTGAVFNLEKPHLSPYKLQIIVILVKNGKIGICVLDWISAAVQYYFINSLFNISLVGNVLQRKIKTSIYLVYLSIYISISLNKNKHLLAYKVHMFLKWNTIRIGLAMSAWTETIWTRKFGISMQIVDKQVCFARMPPIPPTLGNS